MRPLPAVRTTTLVLLSALCAAPAAARPMLTEPVAPVGKLMFETGFSASYRSDTYQSPKTEYTTATFPVEMKLGLSNSLEAGFSLDFVSEKLDTPNARYNGSRTALFNPEVKYSPWQSLGFQFIYHAAAGEEGNQDISIARGDDYEIKTLVHVPTRVPIEFNVGYLFRNAYYSRLGIRSGKKYRIEPGNIAEAAIATEIPVKWGISFLTEFAYYVVAEQSVGGVINTGSDGDALDALVGLSWTRGGWTLGTGVAFGLLDESHTSFDLERGAGDYQFRWMAAYKLRPRKPGQ